MMRTPRTPPEPAPPPLDDTPPTLIDGRRCPAARPTERCPGCDDMVESPAPHRYSS
ncbi:hypothetical protein [Streptomyces sp. SBT349]|uniref:hypothetical protein n=1 Tax=Streptomyces sp. SBT349 TaxID=1580539 RepID=UPI000B01D1F7|nr:hypothetical protein [Streptomyces sp. SBT349]